MTILDVRNLRAASHVPPAHTTLLLTHECTALTMGVGLMDFCQPSGQSQGKYKSLDLDSEKKIPPKLAQSREARDNNYNTTQLRLCIVGSRGIDSRTFFPQMRTKGNI